jgi:hypothetical protein
LTFEDDRKHRGDWDRRKQAHKATEVLSLLAKCSFPQLRRFRLTIVYVNEEDVKFLEAIRSFLSSHRLPQLHHLKLAFYDDIDRYPGDERKRLPSKSIS